MPSRIIFFKLLLKGAGEATNSIALRPPQNKEWMILFAEGFHNDATGRVCRWHLIDHGQDAMDFNLATLAQSVHMSIYRPYGASAGGELAIPLKFRYNIYPQFEVTAMDANDFLRVNAIVEEIDGVSND